MAFVVNASTGEHYITYPVEFWNQIELYKKPGFEPIFAVFRILDAVYNSKESYHVDAEPRYVLGGELVWHYNVTNPIVPIHISSERKDLTPERSSLDDHKFVDEYQIEVGKLFTLREHSGVIVYLCKLLTEPVREKYLANDGERLFKKTEEQHRTDLIALADSVSPQR